jgi:CheY-like chemotaxis protein
MSTIMVVDDHSITQRLLSHTLEKNGFDVVTAGDGREALVRLAETSVDLAIVDLAMPEMDGLTLLRVLRGDDRYQMLPVVMLTASGLDEDSAAALSEGANGFLTKPASSWELVETVNRLLSRT